MGTVDWAPDVRPRARGHAESEAAQLHSIAELLDATTREPAALVIDGEAGIGKSTMWLAAVDGARDRGMRILSARPVTSEADYQYGSLADLLRDVEAGTWSDLPNPQRIALEQIQFHAGGVEVAIDYRAAAMAFLTLLQRLAETSPVLVAIDDVQWLDPESTKVLAYATRRLSGRVGLLATFLADHPEGNPAAWLELPKVVGFQRIRIAPHSIGSLHGVLHERLGRSFPRPTMVRLHDISGGNPFYALELARMIDGAGSGSDLPLPGALASVVRTKLGDVDSDVRETLLAAACAVAPTVELLALMTGVDAGRIVGLLEHAEDTGVVRIDGERLRFAHPLLARGVYCDAAPARRRAMHHQLARIVAEPETRARHLALAATGFDPKILPLLDAAAESARRRGAPAAAAELLDLAMRLGGDVHRRRMLGARYHLAAGDVGRARTLLQRAIDGAEPGVARAEALVALSDVCMVDDGVAAAEGLLEQALHDVGDDDRALRVAGLIRLAIAKETAGDRTAAGRAAEDAVAAAAPLDRPALLAEALGMRALLAMRRGARVDEPALRRALNIEDSRSHSAIHLRPSMHAALVQAWSGQLESAHTAMLSIWRDCLARGAEPDLWFVGLHRAAVDMWRGDFSTAAAAAEDAMVRAQQMGGDTPLAGALGMRARLAAYAGRVDDAACDARAALVISRRCGNAVSERWNVATLGFLALSQQNDQAALGALRPLLASLAASDAVELVDVVPDAIEALIGLGRLTEAEPLIGRLEDTGKRLDRPWLVAAGARGRAMLLFAMGELEAAGAAAEDALAQHDRLALPFERARTQLLLGQIEQRRRHGEAAAAALGLALHAFETLGAPLWAERARVELDRCRAGWDRTAVLTPSEQRVCELAGSGMTNRDTAALLFISPKTVEAHLARVYRKLGIHSRAELGRHVSGPNVSSRQPA